MYRACIVHVSCIYSACIVYVSLYMPLRGLRDFPIYRALACPQPASNCYKITRQAQSGALPVSAECQLEKLENLTLRQGFLERL